MVRPRVLRLGDGAVVRTVEVTVVDRCPVCAAGDVDLSPAAFQKLGAIDEGRVRVG